MAEQRDVTALKFGLDPKAEALRYAQRSDALIRVLTFEEANGQWATCCWSDKAAGACEAMPCFRLATPHGHQDFCRDHIDPMIALLPPEWIDGWAWREPTTTEESDDIPF